jgi:hypothetical protein
MYRLVVILILLLLFVDAIAQSIKGFVKTADNVPIPYAHIYLKNSEQGTTTDEKGYYYLKVREGNYEIIVSSLGYKTITIPIIVYNKEVQKNLILETSATELEQVVIKANRRDPAYEIIQNAIQARKNNYKQVETSRCDVYIKAKELISEKEKKRREKEAELEETEKQREAKQPEENIPKEKKVSASMKLASSMNMVEIKLERNYQYPDKVKEIRQAYEQYGSADGLFFLSTNEADFNFYQNLIQVDNLNTTPLISPLNLTSVLSYKFKLEGHYFENNKMIYHIRVSPRKPGNSTFEGYIDIIEGSFAIRKVELWLEKGGLLYYDYFKIIQDYTLINDSIWLIDKQVFDYHTKSGKRNFVGNSYIKYSNYEIDIDYPKRYFKNEIAVTQKDAFDKDSSFWKDVRPEPLSAEEIRFMFVKDSIHAAMNRKEYLDSLDKVYNKVTVGDVFLWGIGFYNREKKRHIWLGSLPSVISPFYIGGMRLGQNFSYSKVYKNDKSLSMHTNIHYGIRNQDVKGNVYSSFYYNPFKLSSIRLNLGKGFSVVQANQSVIGFMDRANYVESVFAKITHSTEIINGLYIDIAASLKENSSIENYKFGTISETIVENNKPRSFKPYNHFETDFVLKYVPFQKYITEPKRKIVLGSKWPTFSLIYRRGWPDLFFSDIDFDYLEGTIYQKYKIGTMGTSTAKVSSGKFLNTNSLKYENYKIFQRGDRFFFSTPMQNQLQDTTFFTTNWYFEAHYVHQFNGSIINNIPFVRKLKMYETGGVNYAWIKDGKYHYIDVYFGIEKSIRIQRQIFLIGFFFVFGGSNNDFQKPQIKFSINHYDKSDGSWED